VGKGAHTDDPHHRRDHPLGEATRPPKLRDEKEKKPAGNLPWQRHKKSVSLAPSPSKRAPPGPGPPCFKPFWLPRALSCPLSGVGASWGYKKTRRRNQEAVSGRSCRAAFPGASQRGPFPDPSAQAISGQGFDWPLISGTCPGCSTRASSHVRARLLFYFDLVSFATGPNPKAV
jgi:hypothetical protein